LQMLSPEELLNISHEAVETKKWTSNTNNLSASNQNHSNEVVFLANICTSHIEVKHPQTTNFAMNPDLLKNLTLSNTIVTQNEAESEEGGREIVHLQRSIPMWFEIAVDYLVDDPTYFNKLRYTSPYEK